MPIAPVAKALTLRDHVIGSEEGKLDLYGVFNSIRPQSGYPYKNGRFCVFVQLAGGLGKMPCFVDIRSAVDDQLIHMTETRELNLPNRETLVVGATVKGVVFRP